MNGRKAQAARNDTAILEAARAVYAADPDAPIASVATRAGVGISALYRRYASKEELLRKLCGDGLKEYIAAAEAALADDGDAGKVFRRFTLRVVEADAHTLTAPARALARTDLGGPVPRGDQGTGPRRARLQARTEGRRRTRRRGRRGHGEHLRAARRDPRPDAKRTAQLRKRYLILQLDGLRPRKKSQTLPGPPPRWKDRASG